jgi:hypothetical protein
MPTIPFQDDPPFDHQSKRRRVLPPVLDGQVRGWGKSDDEEGDDDDEEYQEDPVDDLDSRFADTTGYKSANGVLHELHALHRRRHLPSSLPNPQLSWPQPIRPSSQDHDKNGLLAQLRPSGLSIELGILESVTPTDELLRVTERYEDTNRCDLFLKLLTACPYYY